MKRFRFSDEQIIGILKEHQAGMSATHVDPTIRPLVEAMVALDRPGAKAVNHHLGNILIKPLFS